MSGRLDVSVNDENGYPCPKDGTVLSLIETESGVKGAWCPTCHTVWAEFATVPVPDEEGARDE